MSAQPSQASLLRAGHCNHYLFSDYYLDQRAPELHEWRSTDVQAAFDALRARWQAVGPALANPTSLRPKRTGSGPCCTR